MRSESIFLVVVKGSRTPPRAFGSIEAIFSDFTVEEVGLPKYKVWGAVEVGKPLKTDKVTIHKLNVVRRRQKTDERI